MPLPGNQCPPRQAQKPICIVDDDQPVAESLKALLETFGFAVLSYTRGDDFLADERRRTAGCLLIDQHMPGMSGLDVVEHLQKDGVQVPAILISGRVDANTRRRAVQLGVRELLDKPFVPGKLIELIRAILPETF
jgi:two-component system response regulator FixJ